jgi:hypothetical protein
LERKNIPEIMTSGLISPAEVDKLFKIYFDRLNVCWFPYLATRYLFVLFRCLFPSWIPSYIRLPRHLEDAPSFLQLVRRILLDWSALETHSPSPLVCAIASRYHTERPELYSIAMHFARRAAASSLIEAAKSVELCQAYILMSVYSMPSRRWEDAREWLYLGLALRCDPLLSE